MKNQLNALTGLRFFAAFLVVMHHFLRPEQPAFAHNVILHGFTAVTLFFVLSGFILTYSYSDDQGRIKASNRVFWVARFARIYPVYLLGFLLYAPYAYEKVFATGGAHGPALKLGVFGAAALGLIQAWSPTAVGVWNPPGWSLSAEAFFYLLFPLVAPLILRLDVRRLAILAVALWVLSLAAQAAHVIGGVSNQNFWMYNPLLRVPEFLLGIVLGKYWKQRPPGFDKHAAWVSIAAALGVVAMLAVDVDEVWFYNGATAPLMMMLIFSLAADRGPLASMLATKPLVLLGEASYSLYILHWPLWLLFSGFLMGQLHLLDKGPLLFVVCQVLSIAASIASFKLLEQPASRLIRKALSSKGATPSPVPAGPELAK